MIAWGFGIYGIGLLMAGWWFGRQLLADRAVPPQDWVLLTLLAALCWPATVPWWHLEPRVTRWVQQRRGALQD